MTKAKTHLRSEGKRFSDHKFDTSKYVVMDFGVYRDSKTGQLTQKAVKENKAKK